MKKFILRWVIISIPIVIGGWLFSSCSKSNPTTPSSNSNSDGNSSNPSINGGMINVLVKDKTAFPSGLSVIGLSPSGNTTLHGWTQTNGVAPLIPDNGQLETGTWTLVAAATPYPPYMPSTLTMSVTAASESVSFQTQQPSLQAMPLATPQYASNNGDKLLYQLTYTQPGSLLVPVWIYPYSAANGNWSLSGGPVTIGRSNISSATVTITNTQCEDEGIIPFQIYTVDAASNTTNPRAELNAPQTISKNFTSNVTVTWTTTGLNGSYCSGNGVYIVYGNLTVTTTNSCQNAYVRLWSLNNCSTGFQTPNGNTTAFNNAGGGSIEFGAGSYNCTCTATSNMPILEASMNNNFSGGPALPTSGFVQLLNQNY